MKKKILIAIGVMLAILTIIVFGIIPKKNTRTSNILPTPSSPVPTYVVLSPIPQTSINPNKKIKTGDVSVVDFYQSPKEITQDGTVLIDRSDSYEMAYYPSSQSFQISVTESPFAEARQKAESEFLNKLGLDKVSACKLKVEVTTPFWANQTESGTVYPLSFCK